MKITKDTKISELIPKGWEFVKVKEPKDMPNCLLLSLKKKEKNFEWYVKEYFSKEFPMDHLSGDSHNDFLDFLGKKDFSQIPFETKIGLLKFICEDLGMDLRDVFNRLYILKDWYKELADICPVEFLESIFE